MLYNGQGLAQGTFWLHLQIGSVELTVLCRFTIFLLPLCTGTE
jgi:hypothetical protein